MKKAQIKMGETMAILLVFFILLGLGLIFYGAVQQTSIKESGREAFQRESVKIALKTTFLPELQCSKKNFATENCMDLYKLAALSSVINPGSPNYDPDLFLFYQRDFGDSVITVQEIFPSLGETYTLYKNEPPNIEDYDSIPTFIPISIRNPTKSLGSQYVFGVLNVTVFR